MLNSCSRIPSLFSKYRKKFSWHLIRQKFWLQNKNQVWGPDQLAPAVTIRSDIQKQVQDHIHLTIIFSVMESAACTQSDLPCSNKLRTALGYFRSRTALYSLGQHLPFSVCRLPLLLFSFTKSSHQSHTSWACTAGLCDSIVPAHWKWKWFSFA